MKNWNDARYLLAVARSGTYSAAAVTLGVNQTTVSRRIDRIESDLGLTLFALKSGRLDPTASGAAIVERCKSLERAAQQLEQDVLTLTANPTYRVTLASTENVARTLLAPNLGAFQAQHPDIRLTLLTSQRNARLDQGDADLAIRLKRPNTGRYIIRKLMDFEFAVYGASSTLSPTPENRWLGYSNDMADLPEAQWMTNDMKGKEPVFQTNDIGSLAEAAASGAGIAMLPCRLGDKHPGLERLDEGQAPIRREAWLLIREEIEQYPHVRTTADWIVAVFKAGA